MRLKPSNAARLLCFLSFLYFGPSSSVELPAALTKSGGQESQDGRNFSSKSYKRIEKVLKFKAPKENISNMTSLAHDAYDFEDNEGRYNLNKKLCKELKPAYGSVWIINASTLDILGNDPQKLIQCTKPGERVAFNLTGMYKFKRTLQIFHPLEFFPEPSEGEKVGNDTTHTATFTCPQSGPFLNIKSSGFNASGFIVQNCTESSGDGALVIQTGSTVMFENIIFKNHRKRAIFVASNANLTMKSCHFNNNGNHDDLGGAIRVRNNVFLSIIGSSFYGNTALIGGAICGDNFVALKISFSNFTWNQATSTGVIDLISNNKVRIATSTWSWNRAEHTGGALKMSDNNNILISNANFTRNLASKNDGGAIWVYNKNKLKIINTTLSHNYAQRMGGAIRVRYDNSLTIANTTLSGNYAGYDGGGISVNSGNNLLILNTTLSWNKASHGGAISLFDDNNLTIAHTVLSENNAQYDGGGIRLYSGNILAIKNTMLSGNTAYRNGGAISLSSSFSYSISNTTVPGKDTSTCNGASSLLKSNRLTILKTKLLGNSASGNGGAISLTSYNELEISNTIFLGNTANRDGGAIWLGDTSKFIIKNTTLSGNNTLWDRGFLSLTSHDSLTISNTMLSGNQALGAGGAVVLFSDDDLDISNIKLAGSNASIDGAIILYSTDHLTILDSTLLENHAKISGGAVAFGGSYSYIGGLPGLRGGIGSCIGLSYCIKRDNHLVVSNTLLSSNQAQLFGGAVYLYRWTDVAILNANFKDNIATSGGAVFLNLESNLTIKTTLFSGNKAFEHGGAVSTSYDSIVAIVDSELSGTLLVLKRTYYEQFVENTALWRGGALEVSSNNVLKIKNSILHGNGATWGGSMYVATNTTINLLLSDFTKNHASRGGVLYADLDCDMYVDRSVIMKNRAEFGGCVYGLRLSTKVKTTHFEDNASSQSGGCFYIDSSTLYVEYSQWFGNEATKEGGAILALARTLLSLDRSEIISNRAYYGGGIALRSNSRVICQRCVFQNNTAYGGGGVHIESQTKQIVVAQFESSLFHNNVAQQYGGGMVIKTFGTRSSNCTNLVEPCSRVLFLATRFVENTAIMSGSALLVTNLETVLVGCHYSSYGHDYSRFLDISSIQYEQDMDRLKMLTDSKAPCESWQNNRLIGGTNGLVIQTFGQRLNLEIDSTGGPQMSGDIDSGYELRNIKSGVALPAIKITAIDAFGRSNVPTLYSDPLVLSSSEFLNQSIGLSFENGIGIMKNIISFVVPKRYLLQLKPRYDDDILEATNLTIVVRDCVINEVSTLEGKLCFECDRASYNFDLSRTEVCMPCPEHANCKTRYIIPKDGYWHQGPCHAKVKKCIVEEACEDKDRVEKLENFSRGFDNCSLSEATLSNYSKVQCHEGYEGPLCGSCEKSYGVSSSFECKKCGLLIISVLSLIAIICYLLLGSSITIKGVLPLRSTQNSYEFVETPLLEANIATLEATSSIQPRETIEETNDSLQIETSQERTSSPSAMEQLRHEIEIAKQKIIESWKILLNFVQVTSTAASMNVKWTDEVLSTMEKLQVLGAATINSVSRPIDCLLSFASRGVRVILRTTFSIFVPIIVIAILAMYWGYRAILVHDADGSYFLKRLLLTVITTTYITYFDLTQVAVRVFDCVVVHDNIDPFLKSFTRSWIADTSIECYKGGHIVLMGIALVVLILVSIGFPLFCSSALLAKKDELTTTNSWAHDTLSFLCGPFKDKFVYWECVTMIKKALLSIIIVFSYSLENQVQGLLLLMVLVFFLYLHLVCNPYDEAFNSLNSFEGGSLLTSCIVYTLVQFLNVETLSEFGRHAVSVCLIVIATSFVCILVYNVLSKIIHLLRLILVSKNVQVSDNTRWFSVLKLYYENRRKRPSA